jgi:hypothetical protein
MHIEEYYFGLPTANHFDFFAGQSMTLWFDPTVGQSSQRQWQAGVEYINEGAAAARTGGWF